MAKYVIHSCLQRKDYVENYLVPSLEEQGIDDYTIMCDRYKLGNLIKCMEIFSNMRGDGSTWHLQDDIILCRDFKKRTEQYDNEIVCGFGWENDENITNTGYVNCSQMWWSFPCILIPNELARECATWFHRVASNTPKYDIWIASKKYDDYFFLEFMKSNYPEMKVLNLKPSLVDHVDYLIGGTTVNGISRQKYKQVRANWFEDKDLVEELEKKLENNNG